MKNPKGGIIDLDIDKYVVYKHEGSGQLLAVTSEEAEKIQKVSHNYEGGFINIPAEFTQEFSVLRYDPATNIHSLTDEKRTYSLKDVGWIFVYLQPR